MSTTRTLDDIRGFDLGFTTREVGEENLFFVAVFACEAKIPLSGGKGMHAVRSSKSISLWARGTGHYKMWLLLYGERALGVKKKQDQDGLFDQDDLFASD